MQSYRDYETTDHDRSAYSGKRPQFITVLAILTFAGSFFGLIIGLISLVVVYIGSVWTPPQASHVTFSFDKLDSFLQWTMIYLLMLVISSVLCTIGAILMLKLKIGGYRLYMISQGIHFLAAVGVILGSVNANGAQKLLPLYIFHLLVCIGFAVMYSVNRKYFSRV